MARLTMISGLQRLRVTTLRGHSIVVVSGRLAAPTDARLGRADEPSGTGRLATVRRQTFRQE